MAERTLPPSSAARPSVFDALLTTLEDPNRMKYVTNALVMLGAMLVAIQFRLRLPYGSTLYGYNPAPIVAFLIMIAASPLGYLTARPLFAKRLLGGRFQFVALLFGVLLSYLGMAFLLPDLSQLQLLYYVLASVALGMVVIALPARTLRDRHRLPLIVNLRGFWKRRSLLYLWVRHNVKARYTATTLGILWIILLPTLQALILAFVFSQVLRMDVGATPFIVFFLSALVPYNFFSQGSINSATSITNYFYLINQVYFPREILPLIKLGELIVDISFTLLAMLVINALAGVLPNANYIYLPILMFISLTITVGMMLILSYMTVIVRDVPQLVSVIFQMLFYLTPILYPIDHIPERFRVIVLVNPLVPLVQAYRDIIAYNRTPDLLSLMYPFVVGLTLLYVGYTIFKGNERRLTDFI